MFKILFVALMCICVFESNASIKKVDKLELIKEMSNNKIVETYVRNILSLTLISSFQDVSALSNESKVKLDEKMKNTLEYGKSVELFFPAYGSLSTTEKKEVLHALVQQVSETNLFKVVTSDCVWNAIKKYAACLGITTEGNLAIFLGCALVCGAIDGFGIVASGGTLTAAMAAIIVVELRACSFWVGVMLTTEYVKCASDFSDLLYTCD